MSYPRYCWYFQIISILLCSVKLDKNICIFSIIWILKFILLFSLVPKTTQQSDINQLHLLCRVSLLSPPGCDVVAPWKATPSTLAWLRLSTRRWRKRFPLLCLDWRVSLRVNSTLSLVWPKRFNRSLLMTTSCSRKVTGSSRYSTFIFENLKKPATVGGIIAVPMTWPWGLIADGVNQWPSKTQGRQP